MALTKATQYDYQLADYPAPYPPVERDDGTIALLAENDSDLLTEGGQRLIT